MTKWEYMTWTVTDLSSMTSQVRTVNGMQGGDWPSFHKSLTEAGRGGWELVGMGGELGLSLVFKRPLPEITVTDIPSSE